LEGQQRIGALVEVPQVLRDLGADPASVIASAGIDASQLRNPEDALSFIEVGKLFQACVTATGCRHFGFLVGQRSAAASLGLVGRLMRNAPTLRDAILDLCTNQQRYVRGAVTYLVIQDETAFWGYAVHVPGIRAIEQLCDGALAVGFNIMQELTGTSPDEVLMSRRAPTDIRPYRQFFGVGPQFDTEQNAFAFPASLLASPIVGADRELRRILENTVADYWAVREPSVADQVIRTLRGRIIFPDTSLEDVAAHLAMHPRTLNRRLQLENTNFRELLNKARFEVAQQLLAGTKMEVTNIAFALGYADPSGFTHAFQRWSGTAPSEWRERL